MAFLGSPAPFFFSSFTVAILASKAVHLIAHFSTVPFSAFIIYLPTFLIYDLLAVFVLRLLLQNSRGGFWLIPVSIGSLISFIAVGGAASQLGFFAQTSGELQWRDAQAYANKEGLEVLLSGSAALLAFTGAIYAVGFVLRNILHNAVGNVLQAFGEDVLSALRWLSKFRSAQLRRSHAEKRDAHPLNKDRDEEGAASAEMLLHNGTARISEDHSDVSTLLDESFPEKGYEYDQPEPSRRRRRLPAWIGLFFFAVYLTIAYITRPARPYDYMSITLPISMLDVFQNHADYCTLQNSIYDNPWPFPDLLAEDHWEKPGANSKGWAPGSDSKLAQEYRERTPQWLPEELPRGFFRWDPLRFKNGFLGSHKPKGPGQTPSCPNVPLEPPFYNPVNDPLKITNLDNDILEPLRKPLEDGSIKIKNVVLVLMESLRQEFWPMKQGSEPWKNIMESHEGESKAAKDKINQILSQMAPHIEQISGVSGGFKDSAGKEFPKAKKHWTDSSAKGFGGVNVVGSYTAASMSTKSFGSVHCGAWPMPVDKFDEADTDSYQPCIPQVLDLFNKAKVDDEAPSDDFRDQEWMPALFEAEVEEYDRQEIFDQKIGFKHIVTRKQIEESPRFNSSNILNQKVNYFAYPEPVLKPHISEFVRSARAKDKRIWMSHFTSTTHHAWDTPSDFSTLDYLPSKGSNAWHTDFNKYLNTLRYHDKWMGELMQLFDDLDMTNETLIVFIGDHGQTFKEDYRKTGTYEVPHVSDFRVPITFRHPHLPRVQSAVNATSISVLPTILDLLVSSGSLNKRDTEMATDLAQDYEGQSLVREYKKKDGKRRAWNFSVINSGAGMLTVTSADVPYKLNMPLEKVFEYMVSNLAEDPTERKAVTAWTYDEMVASVGKKMGNDAKVWAEEAVAVGKWWAKERKRLWRYRTLPFYPGTSGLKGHGPPGFGPPGFGPPGHGPPGHRPPGRGPPPPHPY
ncbi:hypothetical protein BN1708_009453 [Verticillium longisporum]|uniref:Sulfatase N-terminal domain-containing protein n=2 Tax=Verticillium longisporum TaxID=100787 RepID=A0A0G4KHH3_VERLO|nr:hypothetical protein BN1708_009453 [Verticillium longisporum]